MRLWSLIFVFAASSATQLSPNPKALLVTALDDDTEGWQVEEGPKRLRNSLDGRPCMTVERLRPAANHSQYLECAPLSSEELTEFRLSSDKYLGVWSTRSCPLNHSFEEERQKCRDARIMRRQPIGCDTEPYQIGCGIACPASNANPSVGGTCNWLTAPIVSDSTSNGYFLYCAQQTGLTCGEWTRSPCASGTVYDSSTRICIPSTVQRDSLCSANTRPVCHCAQSQVQNVCPGSSSCNGNVCCISVSVEAPVALQPILSCPGSLSAPNGPCDGCSGSCVPNVGCCPSSPPMLPPITSLCPNSYSPAFGQCNSCPTNSVCEPSLNACCPSPSSSPVSVVLLCPTGQPASSACGMNGACPQGTGCYQGGCCPMACPSGQNLIGFCGSNGCSSGSCYRNSGCCCQSDPVILPVCQNGVQASRRCVVDQECSSNQRCSNGGCCPMPFCPNGVQSTARCFANSACGAGMACMDGACCPLPRCPTGIFALSTCTRTMDCGRPGVECTNGGCCPLPQCNNGIVASQRCGMNSMCPTGQSCQNGGCCALPTCPTTGLIAISSCSQAPCGGGFECVSGGCCPLPSCPTGAIASQRCQLGSGCPNGNVCENGVCCPLPRCSIGIVATGVCGMANSCPMGFVCEGRGCCPEPMPLCPSGGRATSRCTRGNECPLGYGCTPLGGCCLLSMEPSCPAHSSAVCQCSPNSGCPSGSSCSMGTCCSSVSAPLAQMPGTSCQSSPQCNGFSSSCAECMGGVCVCTGAAASNGVSCLLMTPLQLQSARSGCDQYGSPCTFVLSTARRRPIFAPTGNITAEPLFYNVATRRQCISNATSLAVDPDATCLPNEKCIEGECRQKMWPGEYGCAVDDECSARCPNTYCEKRKTEKGTPQCQCVEGLLLHGRCFSSCPSGFHESGAACVVDNEDSFWKSVEAQEKLKELLNSGQC